MAMYHLLVLHAVVIFTGSITVVAPSRNETVFQFALVVSESEDASSFYGGGSVNESLAAAALALQHVSSCPDILRLINSETMFTKVS